MTLMELTMIPLDRGASFSKYVAKTISVIDKSGLDYQLNSLLFFVPLLIFVQIMVAIRADSMAKHRF